MSDIGLKDMRAFFAVVEEGNISHAAQRLNIAQPALSRQMKKLEVLLNSVLFERGSREIRLTDAGKIFYSRVENILGLVDGTISELKDIGNGESGTIRLGTVTSSGAAILPDLLASFHKLFPNVKFEIWEGEGARILELLDNRLIDIAITRTQVDPLIYHSLLLQYEPLVIVMDKDHQVGQSDNVVKLSELKNHPLIIPLRWKSIFISNCRSRGFEPNITCVCDGIVQNLLLVKMQLGVSMLPFSSKSLLTDGNLIFKRLIDPVISTHTVVSWLKISKLSKASLNLIDLLKSLFRTNVDV